MGTPPAEIIPYSKLRRAMGVMLGSVKRQHTIYGLIEVDVTDARRRLRAFKERTGGSLSFTAFVVYCMARAIAENKTLNACHKGSRHLVLYESVDVATQVERVMEGKRQPITAVIRGANHKSLRALHDEIRGAGRAPVTRAWTGAEAYPVLRRLPMVVLRGLWAVFWWARGRYPAIQRRFGGTTGVSAVGMFGAGGGWGIPISYHTLDVTIGGIATKPGIVAGQVVPREYLCLTLSIDHDVVDGAPAARFTARLRELIESGAGLDELDAASDAASVPAVADAARAAAGEPVRASH